MNFDKLAVPTALILGFYIGKLRTEQQIMCEMFRLKKELEKMFDELETQAKRSRRANYSSYEEYKNRV